MHIENNIFLTTEKMIVGKVSDLFCYICMHQSGTNCTEIFNQIINKSHISAVVEGLKVIFHKI